MLADRIDSVQLAELATRRSTQSDQLGPKRLPRLGRLMAGDHQPGLDVTVIFEPDPSGLARLVLSLSGTLQLVCQRCLAPMAWPVQIASSLTVVATESDADGLEDPFEVVVMDAESLSMDRIIEDEVLAAVPLAPRHEEDAECDAPGPLAGAEELPAGGTSRPFADLEAILKAGRRRTS